MRPDYLAWKLKREARLSTTYTYAVRDAVLAGRPVPPRPSLSQATYQLEQDVTNTDTDKIIARLRAKALEQPVNRLRYLKLISLLQLETDADTTPFKAAIVAAESALAELDEARAKWTALGSHTPQGVEEMLRPARAEARERLANLKVNGIEPKLDALAKKLAPTLPPPAHDEEKMLAHLEAQKPTARTMMLHRAAQGEDPALVAALIRPANRRYLTDPMSNRHKLLTPEAERALSLTLVQNAAEIEQKAAYARIASEVVDAALASIPTE